MGKTYMKYDELPIEYKVALVIWNIDNDDFGDMIEEKYWKRYKKINWILFTDPTVEYFIKKYGEYLAFRKEEFKFVTKVLAMPDLVERVLPSLKGEWNSFEEYHAYYQAHNPYKHTSILPILVYAKDPEYILDGWHRFHCYYANGEKEVPVLEFVD